MRSESSEIRRWPKWALFVAFLITVPVPFFMVVVVGMVPLFVILLIAVQGLLKGMQTFTSEGFAMLVILGAHVVVLGGLLYIVASGINRFLFRILPPRHATFTVFALIAVLIVLATTLDLYRLPRHGYFPPANIFRVIKEFAT